MKENSVQPDIRSVRSQLWIGSIIAALLASVSIFIVMLQTEKKILSEYEKEYIYVTEKEIPKGTVLTEENYGDYLVLREVDKSIVPQTALREAGKLQGLAAKTDIEAGILLTAGMFDEINQITATMSQPVIAGFKAEDLYQVVGGVIRAGDRIHIYTVNEQSGAKLVWKSVYVERVFDSSGNIIVPENHTLSAQRINVFLDAKDVEFFYTELSKGTLRVVKVCDV
mgnify:CR=1 FL=1